MISKKKTTFRRNWCSIPNCITNKIRTERSCEFSGPYHLIDATSVVDANSVSWIVYIYEYLILFVLIHTLHTIPQIMLQYTSISIIKRPIGLFLFLFVKFLYTFSFLSCNPNIHLASKAKPKHPTGIINFIWFNEFFSYSDWINVFSCYF